MSAEPTNGRETWVTTTRNGVAMALAGQERGIKDEERSYIVNLFTDAASLEEARDLALQIVDRLKDLASVTASATTVSFEEPVFTPIVARPQ